jgi:peptidoglycan/xylan/chitin deacetylase (PgdA/CDA1 family)
VSRTVRAAVDRHLPALSGPVERVLRRSGLRAGVALVYHRVGDPPGDRERELVPNHGTGLFEEQIRYLRRRYLLVAAADLHRAVKARRAGDPFPAAITFDDDLPSHRRVALPILERLHAPAAFFLCGASLHTPHAFWWELLQAVVDRGLADPELVALIRGRGRLKDGSRPLVKRLAGALEEMTPEDRAAVEEALRERLGSDLPATGMPGEDVGALAAAGFQIGFHTRRHMRLTNLDDETLTRELSVGVDALAALSGAAIESISYPHGKADGRVAARARSAGFALGFTGSPVGIGQHSDPLLLGRVEPSFNSTDELAAQLIRALRSTAGACRGGRG